MCCALPAPAPGLLNDLRNNLAQGAQSLKIFETANTFYRGCQIRKPQRGETSFLGLLLYGLREEPCPAHKETDLGYADIKGPGGKFAGLLQLLKARLQAFGKQRLALFQAWISWSKMNVVSALSAW